MQKEIQTTREDLSRKMQMRNQILPIQDLNIQVDKLFNFRFLNFRFGRMPKANFFKMQEYIEDRQVIMYNVKLEGDFAYLMYFMPEKESAGIDNLFKSLFFERIWISDEVKGYPKEALGRVDHEIAILNTRIQEVEAQFKDFFTTNRERLKEIHIFLFQLNQVYGAHKYLAQSERAFFLGGWVPGNRLEALKESLEKHHAVSYMVEEAQAVRKAPVPTKLENNGFFRPFEALVTMYGTPGYKELDPTPLVALTYILMFGMMFGDLGQGLVIAGLGWWLFKKKGVKLGRIMAYLGGMSAVFGLVYGSVFGNEEVIGELVPFLPLIHPMHEMTTVLLGAVGFGAFLLLGAMLLNMLNAWRAGKVGKMLFDRNGLAGMVFYVALLVLGVRIFQAKAIPLAYVLLLLVLPFLIMLLAHPLERLLAKEGNLFPEGKGQFFVESGFEMMETLLGFLSNTISFIRVGAFAMNHVAFFMAFHMLSDMMEGAGSIAVMVFGNILIIVLEGMIVGIQGLRLEYYELFGRFFTGEGIEFKPFNMNG
nr:V-type ATPase 116kDa subunit family protein [Anaerotalea alkaliphila]